MHYCFIISVTCLKQEDAFIFHNCVEKEVEKQKQNICCILMQNKRGTDVTDKENMSSHQFLNLVFNEMETFEMFWLIIKCTNLNEQELL